MIRPMIDTIGQNVPVISLTATATPKVQEDIIKNLKLKIQIFIFLVLIDQICIMR